MNSLKFDPVVEKRDSNISVHECLKIAKRTRILDIQSKNLRQFPTANDGPNLQDIRTADLSRNKLTELPQECTEYYSLERLVLYHNTIRSIPDSVANLHALKFLDLSRNQLSYLPDTICQLPSLEVLVVNNNRLVSLPEEIGKMQSLAELDASCNEITHLPVQIGDMTALRSLNLRRNHLQEVPVEISFLRLIHMDLSANRITTLPVELRFMNSVVELNLGENPLSCPPANLCSRGKVHVFKHLEIQAIKEDRKRGVLTDSEYRRSYRHKTTAGQLNDFRFGNGFGADARRKRHTADSGYGSEQPLDRRWSQDFSQDENGKALDMPTSENENGQLLLIASESKRPSNQGAHHNADLPHTNSTSVDGDTKEFSALDEQEREERRKIASKVLGKHGMPGPLNTGTKPSIQSKSQYCSTIKSNTTTNPHAPKHSDRHTQPLLPPNNSTLSNPQPPSTTQAAHAKSGQSSPSSLLPLPISSPKQKSQIYSNRHFKDHLRRQNAAIGKNIPSPVSPTGSVPIKIEHQQTFTELSNGQKERASTVAPEVSQNLNHQDSNCHQNSIAHSKQTNAQNGTSSNGKMIHSSSSSSSSTYSMASSVNSNASTIRLQASSTSTSSSSLTSGGAGDSGNVHGSNVLIKKTSSYDVKAFQKEAVLSYIKAKQSSPVHSVASLHPQDSTDGNTGTSTHRSASPRVPNSSTSRSAQQLAHGVNSLITSHKNALAQHNNVTANSSSIPQLSHHTNGVKTGKTPSSNYSTGHLKLIDTSASQKQYVARRDGDKSATADSHISQLKMHIESRLRISLPDNLSSALADGVILCHVANHVRPRAVPSIHVPSPAVPKLNTAKCRRNVENFLLACKRIGVREDLICSPSDVLEPRKQGTVRVAITVSELLRHYQSRANVPCPPSGMTTHLSSGHHLQISSGIHL